MAISGDVEKRRIWVAMFAKHRASGISVARFCKQERVSPNTFYYWAKRLRTAMAPAPSWPERAAPATSSSRREAVVCFRWKSGAEVVVPAECLEAIRCLAEFVAESGVRRGEAFQEVVVKG